MLCRLEVATREHEQVPVPCWVALRWRLSGTRCSQALRRFVRLWWHLQAWPAGCSPWDSHVQCRHAS